MRPSTFFRQRRPKSRSQDEQEVRGLLHAAERRSELLLGYMRLAAFAVLLAVLGVLNFPGPHYSHVLSEAIYGVATGSSLVLVWFGYHRPWLAWLLTTLDVALVLHFYAMLVFYGGVSTDSALGAPGTLMIFLFLAHATIRYRPELILYGTILFVGGWAAICAGTDAGIQLHRPGRGPATEIAFLIILGLTALALFLTASRARRLLVEAIAEARLRASLLRFVAPVLAEELTGTEQRLAPRLQRAAILFVDIRGFTSMAEAMSPKEVVAFLNDYRRRVSAAILQHHGTVDKFIGDGVMAVFGIPAPTQWDAANAVRCGLAIIGAIERWNDDRRQRGLPAIRVGAGAHYGDVIVGAIGDNTRLEYTVIGDAVNVAQRLERICAATGETLVVSLDLLNAARCAEPIGKWSELPISSIRGRTQSVRGFVPAPP